MTQEILGAVQPLLEIADSMDPSTPEPLLSEDDQLYVYEVVGVVILAGESSQQVCHLKQIKYATNNLLYVVVIIKFQIIWGRSYFRNGAAICSKL